MIRTLKKGETENRVSSAEATSDNPEPTTEDVVETLTPPAEEVTSQSEVTEAVDPEPETEPKWEETEDELTALYNDYKNQRLIDFTLALCEAGYDQFCLVNGDLWTTTYFSVKDGNHYTIPKYWDVYLYVSYIPTEYSCDNENITLHYWYSDTSDEFDKLQINMIQLDSKDFEGDDVPVNISVTFEDGSTQEITISLAMRNRRLETGYPVPDLCRWKRFSAVFCRFRLAWESGLGLSGAT